LWCSVDISVCPSTKFWFRLKEINDARHPIKSNKSLAYAQAVEILDIVGLVLHDPFQHTCFQAGADDSGWGHNV
jgi:hypothetical protein